MVDGEEEVARKMLTSELTFITWKEISRITFYELVNKQLFRDHHSARMEEEN